MLRQGDLQKGFHAAKTRSGHREDMPGTSDFGHKETLAPLLDQLHHAWFLE
jgi:hypothetical protein